MPNIIIHFETTKNFLLEVKVIVVLIRNAWMHNKWRYMEIQMKIQYI